MAIKVVIRDASVETQTVAGKTGSFQARRQYGMVQLPNGELRRVRIRLQEGKQYAAGEYFIGDGSFIVGQYGDLQLGSLELVTGASPAAAAR